MALSDLYVLTDHQSLAGGDPILNVWTFQREDVTGTASGLIDAFLEDMMLKIQQLQHQDLVHNLITCYNLGDLEDFAERSLTGISGVFDGDFLPAFVSVNFTMRAASRAVRPGSKRIGGLGETIATDGVIVDVGPVGWVEALRVQIEDGVLDADTGQGFKACVIKRVPYTTSSGSSAYRFPEPGDPLVAPLVTAVLANLKLTHQVSR